MTVPHLPDCTGSPPTFGCDGCIAARRSLELKTDPLGPGLSRDQARTRRNEQLLAAGIHPATREPLATFAPGATCATCTHLRRYSHRNRWYLKCAEHRLGESHSADSDVRADWPACARWLPAANTVPPQVPAP